ncbi:diguanylate cyclase [Aggregicoccus sp. 17bor-14]|uniref:diguanylate cyclase n=1 Tax=Myxococcaceae TaxID=31 RepID=UPI00129D187A|nr:MULTISPECIES: diguanylate cyclase [Myxococcaceae]MBF5044727.1 diguanylate cyclase [Simulacricoccus sp. 17bor-14]MRI90472.1 diguanylate cyclase [Aggregicoccus sp. 17bor-14]
MAGAPHSLKDAPGDAPGGAPRRPAGPTAAPELAGRRVLIVDDEPAMVALVRSGLAPQGYAFFEAANGAEALRAVREHRPDLIVMDVEMPGLGGVEVCRIIKANASESGFGFIPVILMTARQAANRVEGLEIGADDYLIKPFDMLELSARVKSMLRLKALQDALVEKNRELDRANKELDRRREELLALSRTDALTGLSNRRYFEERLAVEFARSSRYRSPIALVMLDIDHFKGLNDRYGHPFGDQVLRAVAQVARERLRDTDLLARYGGEELVALLPETGLREASGVAERVRAGIEALRVPFVAAAAGVPGAPAPERISVGCTASLGAASFPARGVDEPQDLVRAADDALYAAKESGRNRVCLHEE